MLEIAEFISPTPSQVWKLAKQAGVDLAVGGLPPADLVRDEAAWDFAPLQRLKERYEAGASGSLSSKHARRSTRQSAVCRATTRRSPRSASC